MNKVNEKNYIINFVELTLEQNKNDGIWNEQMDKKFNDISELKIHKVLYFLYGLYFERFEKDLFEANFQAWKYGPVEINYRYNNEDKFEIHYCKDEESYLMKLLTNLMMTDTWTLVEMSHATKPWKEAISKRKLHTKIENDEIKKYFKEEMSKS